MAFVGKRHLVVAEWLYLDWAFRAPQAAAEQLRLHAEWITLHDNRIFVSSSISCARSWTVSARRTQISAATFFSRAVARELSFFEAAYTT